MAKKKKTQLKSIARGFATTSMPKKVSHIEKNTESEVKMGNLDEAQLVAELQKENDIPVQQPQRGGFEPEKAEEQSLQNLVNKLQEKTDKEIVRTVKTIELDRRLAKSFPRLELEPTLTNRIIALMLESEAGEVRKMLAEPEEKAIFQLGITYGVLRRLNFSESRVEECLRAIHGVDLEEAYDWLYLHCTQEELDEQNSVSRESTPKNFKISSSQKPRMPQTGRDVTHLSASSSDEPKNTPLDGNATGVVSSHTLSISGPSEDRQNVGKVHRDAHVVASFDHHINTPDSGQESPETVDPIVEYAQLKLRYDHLIQGHHIRDEVDETEVQRLRQRMNTLRNNYFFDSKEAQTLYQIEREKATGLALQERLRGTEPQMPPHRAIPARKTPIKLQPSTPSPQAIIYDIFDEEDENLGAGGLLGILEQMPTTEIGSQGTTIKIRDMALPKYWSGRTPKTLLKEIVTKIDRYAAITYNILSGLSRAKRASVNIRWEGRKMDEWLMEDIACYDETQAEQYIATIALHALTFPPTDTFAAGNSTSSGTQTSFRLLPAVFRDLWDELEATRKTKINSINRNYWTKLRSIVGPKLESDHKADGRSPKPDDDLKNLSTNRLVSRDTEGINEQLAAGFKVRQTSSSYQEMLLQRNTLPIAQYREEIVRILERSQVLVLSGETGCGKSTQVPAFILEDQLSRGRACKIYCTEPRRISAISLAQRVSRELGDAPNTVGTLSSLVGYSIRLESNTSRNTRLTFVTNGIALRMLEGGTGPGGHGIAFDEITHIIIDEVHERTIESDFLLIVLKSLLEQRSDLRVILMSATLDAEKISTFFGGCPTLHVPGRTFPVDVQFLEDAIEYAKWSISETSPYARPLHDKFYRGKVRPDWTEENPVGEDEDDDIVGIVEKTKLEKRYSPETVTTINLFDERLIPYDLIICILRRICFDDIDSLSYSSAILIFMPGLAEIRRLNDILNDHPAFGPSNDFKIYTLHSTLSSENQNAVFDIPPPGIRKIVIATNIAETGITIPDITCVIDSGKHREMRFDEKRQTSRLVETFVAKSNAAQRRGRAGRVQRGLCFHLFTKLRYDTKMADHPLPEMMRLSLSDLALRIKIMKVKLGSSIEDVLSRALDPPVSINVQRAISMLVEVRALNLSEEITPMGRLLSKLPTDVHLGKFLLTATLFRCLDPALTIAAALNSKSPFLTPFGFEQEADRAKHSFKTENSDFLTIHNAFASWRRASTSPAFIRSFCRTNYLSHQNLQQIEELRQQFLGYLIDSSFIQVDKNFIRELTRARYGRNRTRFVMVPPELDINSNNTTLINAALTAGLFPKILGIDRATGQMRTISNNQHTSLHPSSVNFGKKPIDFGVNHLAYFTLMHSKKLYAWETGPVDDISMLLLCGEYDCKLISDSASIDRRLKFHISPKTNVALKFLRSQLGSILAHQFRGGVLNKSQIQWNELSLMVLGKTRLEGEYNETPTIVIKH